ncbi:MAG: hypothetical protein AAFZ87_01130 [Planctomycetota bacterium]
MRDPRLWTAVLAVTWFLCGFGAGQLAARRSSDGAAPTSHALYAAELGRAFELDGFEQRTLLDLLEQREIDREAVRRSHEARTRELMEPALREIDRTVERTIRDTILPPSKRARFDRLGTALVLGSAPNGGDAAPAPSGD